MRTFPGTRDGIRLFSDQLQGDMSAQQYSFAANAYAGCQKMLLDDVRNLRSYNQNFIVLHYQLGCSNGPEPFIDGNEWNSDWSAVTAHEDWFMHQGGSRLLMPAWNWYLMDIGNINYRAYWVNSCIQRMRDTECDGVFADSFTLDGYFGQLTPDHPWFTDTDQCLAHWVPALGSYAHYLHAALNAEKFYFLPNLGGLVTGWDTTDYASLSDGGMVEGFGAWGNDSYFEIPDWQLQMNRILALAGTDRIIICQSYTSDSNLRERMFLTGCYLLVKGDHTYFNMIGSEHGEELIYYPEYEIAVGSYDGTIPVLINDLYDERAGCYRRNYSNGIVLVNPGNTEIIVTDLGAAYNLASATGGGSVDENGGYDGALAYQAVTGVTLPPHGAAILLRDLPPSSQFLHLWLDRDNFSKAESLSLHWQLTPDAHSSQNLADAYLAAMTPQGKLYFYDGRFSEEVRPVARSMRVANASGGLGPFPLAGLPSGEYTWYAVLANPGSDPLAPSNRIGNLSIAAFSLY
ncbi:MAG: putative glycoside hydrolase [Candidatus Aureabacteria bacterium]|nr:putative glycoside hydrolase [Candidatus Auribacterota bacterium]